MGSRPFAAGAAPRRSTGLLREALALLAGVALGAGLLLADHAAHRTRHMPAVPVARAAAVAHAPAVA